MEREKLRLLKGGLDAIPACGVSVLNNKIEALKVLTQALLKAIESLDETSPLECGLDVKLSDEVRRFEIDLIRCALIRTGGRQRRAARLLNMKVATLNAKIKRYNLDTDEMIDVTSNLRQYLKVKS